MSRMLGFRLDPDNPREAQALAVLERGQEAGYSIRHIVTGALLALEVSTEDEPQTEVMLSQMAEALQGLEKILSRLQSGEVLIAVAEVDGDEYDSALTDAFLQSVREASKTGIKLE